MGIRAHCRLILSSFSASAWQRAELRPDTVATLAALATLLLLSGCAPTVPTAPAPDPRPAAVQIQAADAEWIARLLRSEDRRQLEDGLVRAALAHRLPEIRRRAALSVGRIGDPAAAGWLREALGDPVPAVRADAAFALGLLGDTAAVPFLAGMALGGGPADAGTIEAVAALGTIGGPDALRGLENVLRQAGSPAVAGEALLRIWRFERQPHTTDLVLPFIGVGDAELRWRAVYALMRLRDPAAIGVLVDVLLSDDHPPARALAARGLGPVAADSAGQRSDARAALTSALDDPHPHVRISAIRALAGFGEAELTGPIAVRLRDADVNVAVAAAESLGTLGGETAAGILADVFTAHDVHPTVRRVALVALARASPQLAVPLIERTAGAEDWLDRLYSARAVPAAWPLSAAFAARLARDPDPRVAASALAALAEIDENALSSVHGLFLGALGDRHEAVRAAALRGLGRIGEPSDLPLLLDAFEAAAGDPRPDAALAAVESLSVLAEQGLPVARTFYGRFLAPADRRVHGRAVELLGDAAWGQAPGPGDDRDLEFYRRVVANLVVPELVGGARPRAIITTVAGEIELELLGADAPLTVKNFVDLARSGYYDDARWHRVVPYFVLQDGDPRGDGLGGPGYVIRDELNRVRYERGTLGMALSGPDTGGSQFFITHAPQPHLDGGYTVFGIVTGGLDAADRVVQDDHISAVRIRH